MFTLKVCDADYPPVTATPCHPPLGKEGCVPLNLNYLDKLKSINILPQKTTADFSAVDDLCIQKSALELAALHLDEFTVADKLNTVVFEILMNIGVFHKLVFPYSVSPSARDALEFISFN